MHTILRTKDTVSSIRVVDCLNYMKHNYQLTPDGHSVVFTPEELLWFISLFATLGESRVDILPASLVYGDTTEFKDSWQTRKLSKPTA